MYPKQVRFPGPNVVYWYNKNFLEVANSLVVLEKKSGKICCAPQLHKTRVWKKLKGNRKNKGTKRNEENHRMGPKGEFQVLPRFELGSLDSESRVLTITP